MKKLIKRIFMLLLMIVLTVGGIVTYQGYRLYHRAVEAVSLEEKVESIRNKENFTSYEELPKVYRQAVVAVEDHRFFEHPGVDVIAIARALLADIKAGSLVQGGSTITQQLAKNLYFSSEQSLFRKAAEVFLAFELEKNYSKEEILELYANTIYFGDGYYTVKDAAEGYFQEELAELSDEECMMLAGIPNAPSVYAPTVNPELTYRRMEQVRQSMERCGFLDSSQSCKNPDLRIVQPSVEALAA